MNDHRVLLWQGLTEPGLQADWRLLPFSFLFSEAVQVIALALSQSDSWDFTPRSSILDLYSGSCFAEIGSADFSSLGLR